MIVLIEGASPRGGAFLVSTVKGERHMMHQAGDLVRINPEYFARNKHELFSSIRQRGPDYVYTVKSAGRHSLELVEEDCMWTNSF